MPPCRRRRAAAQTVGCQRNREAPSVLAFPRCCGGLAIVLVITLAMGCQGTRAQHASHAALPQAVSPPTLAPRAADAAHTPQPDTIELVSAADVDAPSDDDDDARSDVDPVQTGRDAALPASLQNLERLALENNPVLRRMEQEAAAAWDKARYVDKLPDPTLGATFLVPPMMFEPDRQIGEVQVRGDSVMSGCS